MAGIVSDVVDSVKSAPTYLPFALQSAPWSDYGLGLLSGKIGDFAYQSLRAGGLVYEHPTQMVGSLKANPLGNCIPYVGGLLAYLLATRNTANTPVLFGIGVCGGILATYLRSKF